jgi:hypothetical protein
LEYPWNSKPERVEKTDGLRSIHGTANRSVLKRQDGLRSIHGTANQSVLKRQTALGVSMEQQC